MFFNHHYISAIPVREEQRLSEEEELARQLKREAAIFFPDKQAPDLPPQELPPHPEGRDEGGPVRLPEARDAAGERRQDREITEDHDASCREEDSLRRNADGSISHHDIVAARQEAERVGKNRRKIGSGPQYEGTGVRKQSRFEDGVEIKEFSLHLNKQEIKRGIRVSVILDKPRGLRPWEEENF